MISSIQNRMRAKKWYIDNRDKVLSNIKKRSCTFENKEKKRKYDKEYRILNQDKIDKRLHDWYLKNKESMKNKARLWKQKNPEKAQYLRYQERAKEKNSQFALSFEDFRETINLPCIYCGFNEGIVGIDRIDSSVGYLIDNIVPCCKVCNYMKLDHSIDGWFTYMSEIFDNMGFKIIKKSDINI